MRGESEGSLEPQLNADLDRVDDCSKDEYPLNYHSDRVANTPGWRVQQAFVTLLDRFDWILVFE